MWRRIVKLVGVDGKLLAGGDRTRQQRKAVCARKGGNVVAAHTRTRRWACGNGFRHGDGARLNERVVRFGEVRTGDGRLAIPGAMKQDPANPPVIDDPTGEFADAPPRPLPN